VQVFDLIVARSHCVLKLFYLVVQHKLELFKFLRLLPERADIGLFLFNALVSFIEFFFLLLDLCSQVLASAYQHF